MENEIWKDIPGYEGLYQVSDQGRVKSLKRMYHDPVRNVYRTCHEKILVPHRGNHGYYSVSLAIKSTRKNLRIHRLVMFAFHGTSGLVVDHINEIKTDNRLQNLRYCTHKENKQFFISTRRHLFTSKFTGVHLVNWSVQNGRYKYKKWVAVIREKRFGKDIYVGSFNTEDAAFQARAKKINELEGHYKGA